MSSSFGKRVANRCYAHVSSLEDLDGTSQDLVSRAIAFAKLESGRDFNVIRLHDSNQEIALLDYPEFFNEAFPALARSWRIYLPAPSVRFRDYTESLNPPILHRKELLLRPTHPRYDSFAALTATAESLGLFDDSLRISYKASWDELIQRRGYKLVGHEFLPVGNAEPPSEGAPPEVNLVQVQRHLTALSRTTLSAPIQTLLRDALLSGATTFFDYGCGKGDDLRGLAEIGISGTGWDPYHRPDEMRCEADVVNLGFVINVIEDFDERIEALQQAFKLCRRVLAVSAMLDGARAVGRQFRDGLLTGRQTFQKYYTQYQLQQFIESVLDEEAIPAAPGVFYVFRDRTEEQHFFLRRQSGRTRALRAVLVPRITRKQFEPVQRKVSSRAIAQAGKRPRSLVQKPPKEIDPNIAIIASVLWKRCLELGRLPETDEVADVEGLETTFGSLRKALRYCLSNNDTDALNRSADTKRDDILVALALSRFSKRRRFQELDERLQRDVRALFGTMSAAEGAAQELLFSVSSSEKLSAACERAAEVGLGYLEPGQSLQLHSSLVERLPALLRVYLGCATALFGDITSIDLVKLHLQSGKVTLMRFDDFINKPLPAMIERTKVRLRDQEMDLFEYGEQFPPPLLYDKSRYINEEFPLYAEQVAFEESLKGLSLVDLSGHGPSAAALNETLQRARWQVQGFNLMRCQTVPAPDERCSNFFTYRQLIEAGETRARTRIANHPISPDTYNALADLARLILDPIVEYFGGIEITYGFASRELCRHIKGGIAPKLDQHASHEVDARGVLICDRGGAAVDFLVRDEDMLGVARWVAEHLPFDRLYYYGRSRPLHVSFSSEPKHDLIEVQERNGRRIPRRLVLEDSLTGNVEP